MQDIERTIHKIAGNILRIGTVSSVDASAGTAKVYFYDKDQTVSKELFVLSFNTYKNHDYRLPDIDEMVICMFLPNGREEGYIIGSYYGADETPPFSSKDIRGIKFEDGTKFFYDREKHELNIFVNGHEKFETKDEVKITVGSFAEAEIERDLTVNIKGGSNIGITGGSTVSINGSSTVSVTGNANASILGNAIISITGNTTLISDNEVDIKTANSVNMKIGDSLEIETGGDINIHTKKDFNVVADGKVSISGKEE